MNRDLIRLQRAFPSVPRTRGDEPDMAADGYRIVKRSPHPRG